jgi:hypothetical protein
MKPVNKSTGKELFDDNPEVGDFAFAAAHSYTAAAHAAHARTAAQIAAEIRRTVGSVARVFDKEGIFAEGGTVVFFCGKGAVDFRTD